jgi:DNA-binding GntR family transcriptional regulator
MSRPSPTVPARRMVARHEIRDTLQQMILNGEQRAGSKLVQQQLAKQFGVAQGVVREALLELQAYGLVETVDNRGVFVSELSIQRLLDSFDVREIHEGLAARLCCDRVTRIEIRELVEMAQAIHALARQDKAMEAASLDREFHQRLVHVSGNSMLTRLADNYRLLGKVIQMTRDPDQVRDEHLAILTAIEEGRPDDAERLMRTHIRIAKRGLEEQIAQGKFAPRWLAGRPEPEVQAGGRRPRSTGVRRAGQPGRPRRGRSSR